MRQSTQYTLTMSAALAHSKTMCCNCDFFVNIFPAVLPRAGHRYMGCIDLCCVARQKGLAMIRLQELTKRYHPGDTPAVDKLSLDIRPGEIFGFIGANGAGKTTTIKMMTGILAPDEGTVEIFGHDMRTDPIGAKQQIGYVPDNHEIYQRLKGIEYLNFMGDIYGVPAELRQERISALLETYELADAINDRIQSYSHGMKQKLCIVGALLSNPPLWLLDEPLTGLDPQSSFRLKQAMREHCDRGNVVFFSTHVLEVAQKLCDRVGIIKAGKLLAIGTLEELAGRAGQGQDSLEDIFLELTGADVDPSANPAGYF